MKREDCPGVHCRHREPGLRRHHRSSSATPPFTGHGPLRGDDLRALYKLKRETDNTEYLFVSERGSPFSTAGFAKLVARAGIAASFTLRCTPAHAALYVRLQACQRRPRYKIIAGFLGHKNIEHTVRYTEMSPTRFKDFWRD
jgi:site-specific recombinase XerD